MLHNCTCACSGEIKPKSAERRSFAQKRHGSAFVAVRTVADETQKKKKKHRLLRGRRAALLWACRQGGRPDEGRTHTHRGRATAPSQTETRCPGVVSFTCVPVLDLLILFCGIPALPEQCKECYPRPIISTAELSLCLSLLPSFGLSQHSSAETSHQLSPKHSLPCYKVRSSGSQDPSRKQIRTQRGDNRRHHARQSSRPFSKQENADQSIILGIRELHRTCAQLLSIRFRVGAISFLAHIDR